MTRMYHFVFDGSSFLLHNITNTAISFLSDFPWNRIISFCRNPTFRRVIMGDTALNQCNTNKYGRSSANKIYQSKMPAVSLRRQNLGTGRSPHCTRGPGSTEIVRPALNALMS